MNSAEVFISVVMLMVIEIKIIQSLAFREAIRSQHMKKLWTFPNRGGVGWESNVKKATNGSTDIVRSFVSERMASLKLKVTIWLLHGFCC